MDPKNLTKLNEQEHFMLDCGVYLVFKHATQLNHLAKIQLDPVNQAIIWQLTDGHSVNYQVTYKQNRRLTALMNTFVAESLDKNHHLNQTVDQYVYLTNLSFPLGKSYQNPEQFSKGKSITLQSQSMNDDQKRLVKKSFKNSQLKPSTKTFQKFFNYFWSNFTIEQPQFNEDDDISRNNQLVSRLLKTIQSDYIISDDDLITLTRLLNPIKQLLNCNLWANQFDYQHHVFIPGSQIQSILIPGLKSLKHK